MTKQLDWLGHAAERARSESWTLGRLLSRCCELEGISEADVATELGCTLDTLRWIYLCRIPSQSRFSDDVGRVAERFGLEPRRLAALVRRADAVAALASPHHDADDAELLLAARDREEGEDPQ
jgi:hypothetical protein